LGELWLVETTPGSRSASQVLQATPEEEKPRAVDLAPFTEGTKILLVTGIDYPAHLWRLTAPVIKELLEKDSRLKVRIVEDPEALGVANLAQWDVVLLHFQNWEKPGPGEASRLNLKRFVDNGGGLISVHFACGAWHGEWPEFQNILGRVWHGSGPGKSQHDAYGKFTVEIADKDHPVTKGMTDFETTDELYTCLTGDAPIHLLAQAKSKVDQKYYPQAFVRDYGKGRVFLTTLGHDVRSYTNNPAVGELLRNGCAWAAKLSTQSAVK
jgi:type 1 glutamine amidotransferase